MTQSATIPQRLDALKDKLGVSWKDVAEELNLSVSMLMQIKSGERKLGANSLFRLCEVERSAGMDPGSVLKENLIRHGLLLPRDEKERSLFTRSMIDRLDAIESACADLRKMLNPPVDVKIENTADSPVPNEANSKHVAQEKRLLKTVLGGGPPVAPK